LVAVSEVKHDWQITIMMFFFDRSFPARSFNRMQVIQVGVGRKLVGSQPDGCHAYGQTVFAMPTANELENLQVQV
jgi:hypothetical protein